MQDKINYENALYEFINDLKPESWKIISDGIKENKGMSLIQAFEAYLPILGVQAFKNPEKYMKKLEEK